MLASCNNSPASVDLAKAENELLNTEKTWNDDGIKNGFDKTLETYYAEQVILFTPGAPPVKGRAALIKIGQDHPGMWNGLSWGTEKAEVAQSGDMGYTWGKWQQKYTTKAGTDTILYGVYSTVWKKQADGKWQAVLDEVTNTPKPE